MKVTKISNKGLDLIKKYEGFKSKPYLCPAGIPTIGYGSTYYENGSKVKLTDAPITEQRATELLKNVMHYYERSVDSFTRDNVTQNEFDALVCFAYNVGVNALKNSTLIKKVNSNEAGMGVRAEFLKWNKANGRALAGLTKRRTDEANLFFTQD